MMMMSGRGLSDPPLSVSPISHAPRDQRQARLLQCVYSCFFVFTAQALLMKKEMLAFQITE